MIALWRSLDLTSCNVSKAVVVTPSETFCVAMSVGKVIGLISRLTDGVECFDVLEAMDRIMGFLLTSGMLSWIVRSVLCPYDEG